MGESIDSLPEIAPDDRAAVVRAVDDVFWETANTREFETPEEQAAFRWRYFGYYLEYEPECLFVARDGARGSVLGYVCGVVDTRRHPELYRIADHVPIYSDLYDRYPAHLHINLTAAARGRGLGGRLLGAIERCAATAGAPGIHLVTSADARNTSFYRRNGYRHEVPRSLPTGGGTAVTLLFMGKPLASDPL